MITTFKTFNIKTKEVKEYSKPNFGDFGEYILIKADDFDTLAFKVAGRPHQVSAVAYCEGFLECAFRCSWCRPP